MKTIAYLRVSKDSQDVKNQRLSILDFARKEKISIERFIEMNISSKKTKRERKIDLLFQELSQDDTLIVSELSRMGRSVGEIITTIDQLVKNRIKFIAIKEGIRLDTWDNLQAKVIVTLFSLFADIERELISMRTKEALAAAKAAGKKIGRPKGKIGKSKLDPHKEEIKKFLKLTVSKSSIAKIMEVDRSTLYYFLNTRGLREENIKH